MATIKVDFLTQSAGITGENLWLLNYLADLCEKWVNDVRVFSGQEIASFISNYLHVDPSVGQSVLAWEYSFYFIRGIYVNINEAERKISVEAFGEFGLCSN